LHTLILEAALVGLEFQRQRVDERIAQVRTLLPPAPSKSAAVAQVPAKPRRTMSAAARRRISAAQKKRWAEFKAKQVAQAAKGRPKPRKAVKSATA
jgi:hypothetical protein